MCTQYSGAQSIGSGCITLARVHNELLPSRSQLGPMVRREFARFTLQIAWTTTRLQAAAWQTFGWPDAAQWAANAQRTGAGQKGMVLDELARWACYCRGTDVCGRAGMLWKTLEDFRILGIPECITLPILHSPICSVSAERRTSSEQ